MTFLKHNLSLLLVLLGILPYLISISVIEYVPSGDQPPQLHAAYRLAQGFGLTASMDDLIHWEENIFFPDQCYTYITNWPPGYALIIALFLKVGLTLNTAAKAFQIFFILLGLVYWYKLGKKYLKGQYKIAIYTIIVFLSHLYLGDSNLVLWAIFPILTILAFELKSTEIKQNRNKLLFYSAVLTSTLIIFRYQSLVLILIFVGWVISDNKINWRTRIVDTIHFALLPLLTFIMIILINRLNGNDHFTQNIHYDYYFDWAWLAWMIKAIFLETLFLDRIITFSLNFLKLTEYSSYVLYSASFGIALVCLWFAIKTYRNFSEKRELVLWAMISLGMTIIFLGIITIRLGIIGDDLVLLNVARYYKFLFPIIILILFVAIENFTQKYFTSNALKLLLILMLVGLSNILNLYNHNRLQFYNHRFNVIRTDVNKIKKEFKKSAAIGISVSTTELTWKDLMPALRYLRNIENIYFSKPTILFVVIEKPGKGSVRFLKNSEEKELLFYNFNYKKFVTDLKMTSIENEYCTIYWKKFETGKLFFNETIEQN